MLRVAPNSHNSEHLSGREGGQLNNDGLASAQCTQEEQGREPETANFLDIQYNFIHSKLAYDN